MSNKQAILDSMRDFAEARAEKMTPTPLHVFPSIRDFTSMTWMGTYSWSNQEMRQRILDADALVYLIPGLPQVPPEVARDYLRAKYTEKRRHTIDQFEAINQSRAAPLYARIGYYDDMTLVDLSAAYWNITKIVGWDVDYFPGRWLGKKSDNDDFPLPDHKVARSSLVSVGLLTASHVWTGTQLMRLKARSIYINYDLWSLVNDVLHSIACIALKAGAVHIHTDGYILPSRNAPLLIDEIKSWGLMAKIKDSGDCVIKGVGSYRIGNRKTKKDYHFTPHTINKVYTPDISFLKPRISRLSKARINWELHTE